jgi:hypothetical protein
MKDEKRNISKDFKALDDLPLAAPREIDLRSAALLGAASEVTQKDIDLYVDFFTVRRNRQRHTDKPS